MGHEHEHTDLETWGRAFDFYRTEGRPEGYPLLLQPLAHPHEDIRAGRCICLREDEPPLTERCIGASLSHGGTEEKNKALCLS